MNGGMVAAVALGGALGSIARYLAVTGIAAALGRAFPYGTLTVNVAGSFLMGVALTLLVQRGLLGEPWRAGLMSGVLGGFTTFSAFAGETLVLAQQRPAAAALNVGLHLALCLAAVWAGARLAA
ncbi:fluoride efflux transporter CrcB [Immundisolibacter sp.]|uniref:fluoride efflux transporter CrcB n=1 Tax=Immundisolibacter sp. TaxID=1934948 RepID=UPI002627298B|nr:fluoride efflux transporter CrcB [Immundisolibacter sp.]